MKAQAAGKELSISGQGKDNTFKNVVVGDVWICGGQSNMGVGVERVKEASPELWQQVVETTDYPNIRYMCIAEVTSPFAENPDVQVQATWTPLDKTVDLSKLRPSGVGFFFARMLHRELNVPIGFIRSNIGGSGIETWMSMDALRSIETGRRIVENCAEVQKNYSKEKLQKYMDEEYAKAEAKGDKKQMERLKNPSALPKEPVKSRQHPNTGFNGMIAPLTKITVKGFIWDQGEGNAGRAWQYRELLPLLISDWRKYWKQGNGEAAASLPFYIVQIQDWGREIDRSKVAPSQGSANAEIRDAQRFVADTTDNCAIAVTIDHHEKGNTHPMLKNIPGERLAAIALAKTYGKEIVWRGPTFKEKKVEGDKIRIIFDGVGKGLMSGKREGSNVKATPVNQPLDYFAVAGDDNVYVWANAKVDADSVIVWSEKVKNPKNVRYAWEANPEGCNLYNKDGWPATPFRTDDLPYETKGKEEPLNKSVFFMAF
jgi:sialate O-acetylesterase